MSRAVALLLLLGVLFLGGALWMFGVQFEAGSGYPAYSSFRRDAAGTRILYDSLASIPALKVERNEQPLEWLRVQDATVLLVGMSPIMSQETSDRFAEPLEDLARRGNRVVVAFTQPKDKDDDDTTIKPNAVAKRDQWPIEKRWHLAPDRLDAVELEFAGQTTSGSILVTPDAEVFRNRSFAEDWSPRAIAGYLGNHRRIVFDESHLGLVESGSIVGLARRYRLQGFAFGAAIVVLLFVWRSTSQFPRPDAAASKSIAGRASAAGLAALLGQNVAPQQFISAAWAAWLKGKPAVPSTRRSEAEALVQNAVSAVNPIETLTKIHASLQAPRRPRNP